MATSKKVTKTETTQAQENTSEFLTWTNDNGDTIEARAVSEKDAGESVALIGWQHHVTRLGDVLVKTNHPNVYDLTTEERLNESGYYW